MRVSVFCSPLWAVNRAGRSPENTCEHIPPGGKGHGLHQQLGPIQRQPCLLSRSLNIGVDVGETARNGIALSFLLDKQPSDVEHLSPKRHSEKRRSHNAWSLTAGTSANRDCVLK